MKALVFDGERLVLNEDHPEPTYLRPLFAAKKFGDGVVTFPPEILAVIRPMRVGICGTDLAVMAGTHGSAPPVALGHEIVGVVESVGASVTHLQPGDRVAVDANVPCGLCHECRRGAKNRCIDLTTAGIFFDGGMAERMVMPAAQLIQLPESLHWDRAALFEPLSCVVHGIIQFPRLLGSSALIVGGGPIGWLWAAALRACGVREVSLAEPSTFRRRPAQYFGVATAPDISAFPENRFDLVVDAAGVPALTPNMIRCARPGGQISLFGQQKAGALVNDFPIVEANQKELAIVGSYATAYEFEETIEVLERPEIPFSVLVSHRLPLERAQEGFTAMREGESMKVLILPNGEEA